MIREAPKSTPCACCGSASETAVWGIRVCYRCHAVWIQDERFSSGAINTALGLSDKPEQYTPAGHALYVAEATKRTMAWVLEQSKARAA